MGVLTESVSINFLVIELLFFTEYLAWNLLFKWISFEVAVLLFEVPVRTLYNEVTIFVQKTRDGNYLCLSDKE